MNGSDFIRLAARLVTLRSADEACFRSAVSRAYYGAFHLAREFLEELQGGPMAAGPGAHGDVRRLLTGSGHPEAVKAGEFLGDLHSERIKADYKLARRDAATLAAAQLAVETALAIEALIVTCSGEPARSEVAQGIANYIEKLKARSSQP